LAYGDVEYRFAHPSFPLHPGEEIMKEASPAYGDVEYRFAHPSFPLHPGEEIMKENKALLLSALINFKSEDGVDRVAREQWLFEGPGVYRPRKEVKVLSSRTVETISPNSALFLQPLMDFKAKDGQNHALYVKAKRTHVDNFGKRSHIFYVNEEVFQVVSPIVLASNNYCVICDPVNEEGVPRIEHLDDEIMDVYVLGQSDDIILRALESFQDGSVVTRTAGEEWMLTGPLEYVPPIEVEVVTVRKAIPLDENEGIYVRDKRSGQVRAVIGSTYLLNQDEELWPKKLSPAVITYRVPHNATVHINDYKGKKSRVVFGPVRVMLGPDEEFTLVDLSGGKPKRTNIMKTICLLLGPEFCTDVLQEKATKLFSQPDFLGNFCKTIAARMRGIVASVNFGQFHKNSVSLIRQSVFGTDADDIIGDRLFFPHNNLVVKSVDVQAVEPVDQRTQDALQKSVQLAIEITSNSQEASAR
uniref:Major vault protein n=1 Tax=Schistocephalus solidus TaxID=70667 RepID=A0A183TRR0_SCHSO